MAVLTNTSVPQPPEEEKPLQLPSEEIKRRLLEKAALLAELEQRNPRPAPTLVAAETEPPLQLSMTGEITADVKHLARLAAQAKKFERIANRWTEAATQARQRAIVARTALNDYMRQNGLA